MIIGTHYCNPDWTGVRAWLQVETDETGFQEMETPAGHVRLE